MAKAICCAIQKGGTGKTTTSGNLGRILARKARVLLVDADPQGSLTSWLLTTPPDHELADILQGQVRLAEALVPLGKDDALALVPTFGIGGHLRNFAETTLEKKPFICADLVSEAGSLGFDIVLFDTHPGDSRLERAVLIACFEVVVPVTLEYFSIDGIEIFKTFISEIAQDFRHTIRADKLVLSMVNRSFRRHGIYEERARALGYQIFEVMQTSRIPEAQMVHQFLSDYDPASRVIPELERLAGALLEA
jgi:chromosome partitioning protein